MLAQAGLKGYYGGGGGDGGRARVVVDHAILFYIHLFIALNILCDD